jgi:hypothetical protein
MTVLKRGMVIVALQQHPQDAPMRRPRNTRSGVLFLQDDGGFVSLIGFANGKSEQDHRRASTTNMRNKELLLPSNVDMAVNIALQHDPNPREKKVDSRINNGLLESALEKMALLNDCLVLLGAQPRMAFLTGP